MKGPADPLLVLSFYGLPIISFYRLSYAQIARIELLLGEVGFCQVGVALHFG